MFKALSFFFQSYQNAPTFVISISRLFFYNIIFFFVTVLFIYARKHMKISLHSHSSFSGFIEPARNLNLELFVLIDQKKKKERKIQVNLIKRF